MSATEYIAIDNTLLRPGVHVDGRSGMAQPDWSRQAQESTTIVLLTFVKNKLCFILYVFVALGAVARVNWVIPCDLPEYINYVSLT